jgi:hypothetical protein
LRSLMRRVFRLNLLNIGLYLCKLYLCKQQHLVKMAEGLFLKRRNACSIACPAH